MEETSNISTRRTEVTTAIDRAKLCHDLVGGTPAMQEGGWILKGSAETNTDWENRTNQAYLYNGYKRTRGYLTGQVFARPIEISEESDYMDLFDRMKDDIDLQGNNLRNFAQKFFEQGLDEGIRFLLVQYPDVKMDDSGNYWDEENKEWVRRTKQVDKEKGWRPYFVQFGYSSLLGWRYKYINGVKTLTQLRIIETVLSEEGEIDTQDKTTQQVRLFEPGYWAIYRKASTDEKKDDWYKYEEGTSSINVIPLALWMPGEGVTDLTAIPALEDLAYLNVRHFIATADQNVLMAYVRRPPWFGRQLVNDGESVQFGPGRMIHSTSETSELKSVGVDPSSVAGGRLELDSLEDKMSLYGLMMLSGESSVGGKTATEAGQEATESISQLKNWALTLKDTFDQAFKYAAMYEGLEAGTEPEILVNTEFQPAYGLEPQVIIQAVDTGLLSKEVAFEEFKRRGLVNDSYDWQDVMTMIKNEGAFTTNPTGQAFSGLASRLLAERQAAAATQQ